MMGTQEDKHIQFVLNYEIEMNSDQEEVIHELLSYLEFTKKIERFRLVEKHIKKEIKKEPAVKKNSESTIDEDIFHLIDQWKHSNALIRLTAVKQKGVRLNIACKILNFEQASGNLTVYDVDAKKVELLHVSEIEDIQAAPI